MIRRAYLDVGFGQLHARLAGAGAPVLCLHPSPLHAGFLTAQLTALAGAGRFAVGLDAPGYGQSDPLPEDAGPGLDPFAAAVLAAADALGLETFDLYGAATGAQIALATALRAPERVGRMALDNLGHFTAAERAAWAADYFPDLTPRGDGGHLSAAWTLAALQTTRFPWHLPPAPGVAPRPTPPPAALTAIALATLQAGAGWDRAYRAAFDAEDAASFTGLTTPTVLIDWADSLVRPQFLALTAHPLPACVRVAPAGPGLEARLAVLVKALEG